MIDTKADDMYSRSYNVTFETLAQSVSLYF